MNPFVRQTDLRVSSDRSFRRRDFLRLLPALGVVAGTLRWTDLVAAESQRLRKQGKSVILLWMQGGPSQFETFSPVDHANAGETKAIDTVVPGIQVAETLPHTAKIMDDLCVIRSMTSKEGSHPRATFLLHTGYLPNPSVQHPAFGANVVQQLAEASHELPSYVHIGRGRGNAGSGGLLGVDYDPFFLSDPQRPPDNSTPTTDVKRFRRRLALLDSLDRRFARTGASREAGNHDKLYERASRMMLSSDMKAFDIEQEPKSIRDAYGDSAFGAGCLLARRLVEHGVTFVEVSLGNWDTHQDNFSQTAHLCGQLDQPYAQLITDLQQRGRLDKTLVIWMGEFGRTPRINARGGRDHFPRAFATSLAGCGVRGGQVIGQLDASGANITDRPVTVPDLFQTLCSLLDIDPDHENMSPLGRPIKIADEGQVVQEVIA